MDAKFGTQIKRVRKANHLTQKQLADLAGISLSALCRYESDERQPTLDTISALASAVGLEPHEFLWCDPETKRDYFWTDKLEDKLKQIGYSIGYNKEDAALWINYPDGILEVTEDELYALNDRINRYLKFELEELKNSSHRFRKK